MKRKEMKDEGRGGDSASQKRRRVPPVRLLAVGGGYIQLLQLFVGIRCERLLTSGRCWLNRGGQRRHCRRALALTNRLSSFLVI